MEDCLAQYGEAIQSHGAQYVHRVARRLLDPESVVGQEMRAWLTICDELVSFPHAYCALMEYALINMVERRVESVHAPI